jgi:aldose 1-epimerase
MDMSEETAQPISRRSVLVAAALGAGTAPALGAGSAAADTPPQTATAERWATVSGREWTIQSGTQKASFVELGGGIREYTYRGIPIVDDYPLDSPIKSAGRVLAPWPNRLGDGAYTFAGVAQQVPLNEVARRNAIHGFARWLPWDRVAQTRSSITLSCLIAPQQGYPFALALTTRWSLGAGGLRVEHTATNVGPVAAPFGLGAHPYLRLGDAVIDNLVLQLPVTDRLLVDDRLLPTGRAPVAGTPYDFNAPRPIGTLEMDTAFTGLTRGPDGLFRTSLSQPQGIGFEVWQDASFGWVQIYTGLGPSGRPRGTLAVEPMTCPPDAFRSGENLLTLQPGTRWSAVWGIKPTG